MYCNAFNLTDETRQVLQSYIFLLKVYYEDWEDNNVLDLCNFILILYVQDVYLILFSVIFYTYLNFIKRCLIHLSVFDQCNFTCICNPWTCTIYPPSCSMCSLFNFILSHVYLHIYIYIYTWLSICVNIYPLIFMYML